MIINDIYNTDVKLIALDLDGTTLNGPKTISGGNRAALLRAIDKGIVIAAASGRPLGSLPDVITAIREIRYVITSNGAEVYDRETGECLKRAIMEQPAAEFVLAQSERYPVQVETFIEGHAYCSRELFEDPYAWGVKPGYKDYITNTRTPVDDIRRFIRENQGRFGSIDFVVADPEIGVTIREESESRDGIYVTSSVDSRVEFSTPDAGKDRSLLFLADYLGVDLSDTAAFGNADNDAGMLEIAGTGIAVADSSEMCLLAADRITKPCVEDGVAWAFENILGI